MAKATGPKSGSQRFDARVVFVRPAVALKRRDARANRARLLDAAAALAAARGLHEIAVDEIAARAGVGKGTVYRAFGDKAGLAIALLDREERALQEAILTGPPPLGRGAPPAERALAFAEAYVAFLDRNLDLLLVAERGGPAARYHNGAYDFWLAHLRGLVNEASPGADDEATAHGVLALLAADLFLHLRRELGYPPTRIGALVAAAVRGLLAQGAT